MNGIRPNVLPFEAYEENEAHEIALDPTVFAKGNTKNVIAYILLFAILFTITMVGLWGAGELGGGEGVGLGFGLAGFNILTGLFMAHRWHLFSLEDPSYSGWQKLGVVATLAIAAPFLPLIKAIRCPNTMKVIL